MAYLSTTRSPAEHGAILTATLPPGAAGAWCAVRLRLADPGPWWASLTLIDQARGQRVRDVFLGPLCRRGAVWQRATLVHVPAEAHCLTIQLFGTQAVGAALRLEVLSRARATAHLLWQGAPFLPAALRGARLGVLSRVRAQLGQAPARAGQAPPYAAWIAFFEHEPDPAALKAASAWDGQIGIIAGPPAAVEASLASAAAQLPRGAPARLIAGPQDWEDLRASWIVLIQAGEILAPGACAAFALAASHCPWASVLTADCDSLDAQGARADPLFKPGPDPPLARSGLLARGAMAVRHGQLAEQPLPLHAEAARAILARAAPGRIAHVPGILSHVPHGTAYPDVPKAPPVSAQPAVSIIVPSAARARHVTHCLRRVALGTDYGSFTIKLVLAAPGRARARVCRAVAHLPGAAILPVDVQPFNYARVNNQAARQCDSELLLLMNDDVAPIGRDWLSAMVAHMNNPEVGIVGARLLYGNGAVQHEGVIMGLANLCEHAGRLREACDPGPHGIGLLDREVSAVTGACLLIRACLYRELGGMDEAYAVALNDVDLCLRARQAGWRVVYCANAVLHHYESLSLGRHYAGSRAGLEAVEVRRLRDRFAAMIGADPFYSPLASLQPGREWQPAFPPRAHAPALGAAISPGPACGQS